MGTTSVLRKILNINDLKTLGQFASVDVGVVTGMNNFFNLKSSQKMELNLESVTRPIITKSAQLKGIELRFEDWELQLQKDAPNNLLYLPSVPMNELPEAVQQYIKNGEELGWNEGYKCQIRKHWYSVPSVWVPDAFLLRQIYRFPKIVTNKTEATCTDTVHRIKLLNGINVNDLAMSFLNSLTFAFTEVFGRSYGGGVLELQPSEAEKVPVPYDYGCKLDFNVVNKLIIENDINGVLKLTDKVLLEEGLGLEHDDAVILRGIWTKLSSRRINRR